MARKPTNVRRRPSFFKIIVGDFKEKLRIPPAFIKHFNGAVPNESILRSPTGKVWHVKVKKVGNDLFFQNGWADFVKGNLFQIGDFLIFTYQGNSEFDVKMFDKSGCEKVEALMEKSKDECCSYEEKEQLKEREHFVKNTGTCQFNNSKAKRKMQSEMSGNPKYDCPSKLMHPHNNSTWRERRSYNMDRPYYRSRALWGRVYSWWEVMDPTVRDLIDQSPFARFMEITPLRVSRDILGAMVERWNGETNTFHLPFGEATITPMDFFMLTGLPMDGAPVVFHNIPDIDRIRELIGDVPPPAQLRGNTVQLLWIVENFEGSIVKTDEERLQHMRAFIWALLAGVILCNGSGCVHVGYLELLAEVPQNKYDWGGAGYAQLLHSLRRATHPSTKSVTIGGLAIILVCWLYEHFPDIFPLHETAAPTFPCMRKWACLANVQSYLPSCYDAIRPQLDSLERQKFIADPYHKSEFASLPEAIHASFLSAHRVVFRFTRHFEWYLGDRVRTQFGKDLRVPCEPDAVYPVCLSDEEYIHLRANLRPESEFLNPRLKNYLKWYSQSSRPHILLNDCQTRRQQEQQALCLPPINDLGMS